MLPSLRGRGLGEVELLQRPGEVIAFPAGWWHAVVNLDATLAVTESFGRPCDLPAIWRSLNAGGLAEFAAVVWDEAAATGPPRSSLAVAPAQVAHGVGRGHGVR